MQLSAFADLESASWDVAVDGRWLGEGPGERASVDFPPVDLATSGSARLVAVWLSNGEAYTLSAVRPAGAKGQDRDAITVALPESQSAFQVFDPRLSTEYTADGTPRRFGLELWLGEDEEGDQRPVRLAGDTTAVTPALTDGRLSVHPMRAQSGAVPGLGLYLLIR